MTDSTPAPYRKWCVVELMGHDRFGGVVSVSELGGDLLSVDVPVGESFVRQHLGRGSIFRLTETDEITARLAIGEDFGPISPYDVPRRECPELADVRRIEIDGVGHVQFNFGHGWGAYGAGGDALMDGATVQEFPDWRSALEALRDEMPF